MSRVKVLWIHAPYLEQILAGRKTVEVRVGYKNIQQLQPGDRLRLNDQHLATIRRVGNYADFVALLAQEDPASIAPDLPPGGLLAALRQIYPPEKEALGAVALELQCCPGYEAVLFDVGYTLVGFEPPQPVIYQHALRDAGAERSLADIESATRVVWGEYYRDASTATFPPTEAHDRQVQLTLTEALLAHLGLPVDPETVRSYTDSIESWFSRPGVMRPYPDVVETLETLKARGLRLGVVSNWSWNLRDRLAEVGLDGYFEIIWASAYAGYNKPHPAIFFQALERMPPPQPSVDRALYVGDSYEHDIVGARNAGLDAVLLDRDGKLQDPDCTVIHDLWSLPPLLGV